jgi:hypothetical protein
MCVCDMKQRILPDLLSHIVRSEDRGLVMTDGENQNVVRNQTPLSQGQVTLQDRKIKTKQPGPSNTATQEN